jgi:hypothetical protein
VQRSIVQPFPSSQSVSDAHGINGTQLSLLGSHSRPKKV